MIDPQLLPKSLRSYASRLASYNDERPDDNPIFIGYVEGWKSWTDPVGLQHADAEMTIKEILFCVRNAIPCDCIECKTGKITGREPNVTSI